MDTYNILFLIRIHCKSETNGSEMWNRKIQKEQFWVMKNENESHLKEGKFPRSNLWKATKYWRQKVGANGWGYHFKLNYI